MTVGSRWRSPLTPGDYDGKDMTLHVYNWADRQAVSLSVDGHETVSCEASVDVSDGKAHVEGRSCAIDLVPTADGIRLSGFFGERGVDTTLHHRRPNALVGHYIAMNGAEVEITSSRDGEFTLSAVLDGVPLASEAKATVEGAKMFNVFFENYEIDKSPLDRCLVYVERSNDEFELSFIDVEGSTCPIDGIASRK